MLLKPRRNENTQTIGAPEFVWLFFASPQELSPHKQSTPTHLELGFISAFWARNWKQNRLFAFRETRVRVGKNEIKYKSKLKTIRGIIIAHIMPHTFTLDLMLYEVMESEIF